MPADRVRRRKNTDQYEIVIIPVGQGGKPRSYRTSALKLWIWGTISLLVVASVVLAALLYTPLVKVVPIPSAVLEEKYGRQLVETQSRLRDLAGEVIAMKEYDRQLRTALGGGEAETSQDPLIELDTLGHASEQADGVALTESTLVAEYGRFEGEAGHYAAMIDGGPAFRAELPLVNPVEGIVSQQFNPDRMHFGIDFASATGRPVFAAAEGYVLFSGWTPDDGSMLMISHGGGYVSIYKHNQSLLVAARAFVKRGDAIALVGSSGKTSRGPHLHFEVWKDGVPMNPEDFLLSSSPRTTVQ